MATGIGGVFTKNPLAVAAHTKPLVKMGWVGAVPANKVGERFSEPHFGTAV